MKDYSVGEVQKALVRSVCTTQSTQLAVLLLCLYIPVQGDASSRVAPKI
jgi:hypothetical protein